MKSKEKVYRKKRMKSMRTVLLVAIIFIIVLPVFTVSMFAYKLLNDRLYDQFHETNRQAINAVDSNMELYMDGVENLLNYAMIADELVDALCMERVTEKGKLLQYWALSEYISKLLGSRGDVDAIRLYDSSLENVYDSHVMGSISDSSGDEALIESLRERSIGCQFFGPAQSGSRGTDGLPAFQVGTKIVDVITEQVYGYLLVDLNYSMLEKTFDTNGTQGDFLVLYDGLLVYDKNDMQNIGKEADEWNSAVDLTELQKQDEQNYYLYYQGANGLSYVLISEKEELLSSVHAAVTPLLIVSVVCCLIFTVASVVIVNRVVGPLGILKSAMTEAQKNNFNNIVYVENTFREVQQLAICFNVMQVEIKKLMQSEKELLQKKIESEYRALQFQITPHFLYNLLDSINCLACSYGKKDISEMILSLSRIFRYSTQQGRDMVTLKDEVNHVKNYCMLQAVRYQDRFCVEYQVPDELMETPAIKFMLQPLVENAIYHGMSGRESGGRIVVGAIEKPEAVWVYVWDNGMGFSEEQYQNYQDYFSRRETDYISGQKGQGKIGLENVHIRLRFTFGNDAGLFLWREDGTAVCIRLPKEETNA